MINVEMTAVYTCATQEAYDWLKMQLTPAGHEIVWDDTNLSAVLTVTQEIEHE